MEEQPLKGEKPTPTWKILFQFVALLGVPVLIMVLLKIFVFKNIH